MCIYCAERGGTYCTKIGGGKYCTKRGGGIYCTKKGGGLPAPKPAKSKECNDDAFSTAPSSKVSLSVGTMMRWR